MIVRRFSGLVYWKFNYREFFNREKLSLLLTQLVCQLMCLLLIFSDCEINNIKSFESDILSYREGPLGDPPWVENVI